METKKINECHTRNATKAVAGYKPNEAPTLFWCRHSDGCKSQMNFGDDKICLQSPLYNATKKNESKEGKI